MTIKRIEDGSKNQWIFEGKVEKNRCKIALKTHVFLDVVFEGILSGFGAGFGRVWEALGALRWDFLGDFKRF